MHDDEDIEMTPSYRGSEGKGEFLGLPGNTSLPLVIALAAGIFLLMLGVIAKIGYVKAFIIALTPIAVTSAVVFLFVHNKPKGYLLDFLSQLLGSGSMSFNPRFQKRYRPPSQSQ